MNAVGDVFTLEGMPLTGGDHAPGPPSLSFAHTQTTLTLPPTPVSIGAPCFAWRFAPRMPWPRAFGPVTLDMMAMRRLPSRAGI